MLILFSQARNKPVDVDWAKTRIFQNNAISIKNSEWVFKSLMCTVPFYKEL